MKSFISTVIQDAQALDSRSPVPWRLHDLGGGSRPHAESAFGEQGESAPTPPTDEKLSELESALEEALAREDAVRREVERLEAEREQKLREAYEEGFQAGREEGQGVAMEQLRAPVQAAEKALASLRSGERRWVENLEENLCALAVTIARQVLERELQDDVEPVLELVQGALREFPIDQSIRIRLHPRDLEMIQKLEMEGEPLMDFEAEREVRWVADSRIVAGGCVVEGRERIIDGRVDTALERIYRQLSDTHA